MRSLRCNLRSLGTERSSPSICKLTMERVRIAVGGYDGGLVGLSTELTVEFAFILSSNSVKCLSERDGYLVAGGFDELLRVFNVKEHREVGSLLENMGSINCAEMLGGYIYTGNEQGNVCI